MRIAVTRVYLKKERMYTYLFGRALKRGVAEKHGLDYKNIDVANLMCEITPHVGVLSPVLRIDDVKVLSVSGKKNKELLEAEQFCLNTYMLKREGKKA